MNPIRRSFRLGMREEEGSELDWICPGEDDRRQWTVINIKQIADQEGESVHVSKAERYESQHETIPGKLDISSLLR